MDPLRGEKLLNDPLHNKGTAFTSDERDKYGLHGLLPFHVLTMDQQVKRRYDNFQKQPNSLAKYLFLSSLQNSNEVLFYRLVSEHISEMLPLIYTPTVGEASIAFSSIYTQQRGLFLSYPLKDRMREMIGNISKTDVDVIVVTDGERILGLGDLGANGMAISVGKSALYTLFGGIHPARTLPVLLDVGTNNQSLLNDPLYLGWRHARISGKEYDDFVDLFVTEIKKKFPRVLLQWEDFAKPHAQPLLDRYRDKICSFNDDIQGTAAVVLAAVLSGVKIKKEKLSEQRIVIFGAGSAGMGIFNQLMRAIEEEGLSREEALKCFYLVDREGLIHAGPEHITLLEVITSAAPTILIGVSGQSSAFTEKVVKGMAKGVKRPMIFPLSNPTEKSEAIPEDLLNWTGGKAIIATGSPFPSIAQCNNVYIFPGVGLGTIASSASKVTDKMFLKAAHILAEHSGPSLFPAFENLRVICREVAIGVALTAQEEGVAKKTTPEETIRKIDSLIWLPHYS